MADYKKLSESTFNMQTKTYDTYKNGKHARTLYQHVINQLETIKFDNLLDVGCGTGEILTTVKRLYPNTSMYGIDISEEMLKKAKEKVLDTVTLSLGDAEHLPFENGKFDCLLCTDSFHHYPTPKRAIAEFCRVLDTNGYLILADFWKPFPIRQAMNIFIPFSNEGDVRIYSKSEIINFLEASGFQDIQYRNINKSGYLVIAKK